MKPAASLILAVIGICPPLHAATITDFTGLDISASVDVIDNGDVGTGVFSASLSGPDTAVIGSGTEFSVLISGPGIFNFVSGFLDIDISADGTIEARGVAAGNTGVGSSQLDPFSFSLSFTFNDPAVEVLSYTSNGNLVRGSASVSGFDPVVWTFASERDNAFGNLISFSDSNPIPSISITEAIVPVPAAVWLFGSGLLGLTGLVRRNRRSATHA